MKKVISIFLLIFIIATDITVAQVRHALISQAEKGDLETIKYLAESYLKGTGSFSKDLQEGFKWTKKAAELGDGQSQFILSNLYLDGEGTAPDEKLGWFWLEKSAKSMYPMGVFKFAMLNHFDQNFEEAYKWFKIANIQFNFPESDYYLGVYHFLEIGGTKLPNVFESKIQNMVKAEEYLRRCCANEKDIDGDAHAILFDLYSMPYKDKPLDAKGFQMLEFVVEDGIQHFPDCLKLMFQKGELYLKMGYNDKAKNVWEEIKKRDFNAEQSESILAAAFGENIDYVIPNGGKSSPYTCAIIIANENYKRVPNVPHAINDGSVFKKYLLNTFGVPEENIEYLEDASLNDIKYALANVSQKCEGFKDKYSVIVYYAGHGVPDEKSSEAFLLPVDGFGTDHSTGLALEDFYNSLSQLSAKSVVVLLDACFSGAKRDGGMLMASRGITIKPKMQVPDGKLIVLSATSEDQTAFPIEEQKHGLFTYTLLRKIQETNGDITWGELADYVTETVKTRSIDLAGKLQSPTVSVSPSIKDFWRNQKIR